MSRLTSSIPLAFRYATSPPCRVFFFFNDTATTEIYPLSLHDALPILPRPVGYRRHVGVAEHLIGHLARSEEHTSELQSRRDLGCRLLREKKEEDRVLSVLVTQSCGCCREDCSLLFA